MTDSRYEEYLEIKYDFWQLSYIGRGVTEQYYEMFDHNGYYPSDDEDNHPEYCYDGIVMNIKLDIDYEDRVTGISYYKVVEHGIFYKGSDDRPINAHDIKVFKEVLDACTVSEAPSVLEKLLTLPLKEGWTVKRVSEKSISLENKDGSIAVPKDYIYSVIDIAKNAPDIKDNEDFWEINKKHLRSKYKDAIFALMNSFTHDNFPDVQFAETAKERIEREDREERAKKDLIKAIKKHNDEETFKLTSLMDVVPNEAVDAAIECANTELLSIFAEKAHNSFVSEKVGRYAVEKGETTLLSKLLDMNISCADRLIYAAYNGHRLEYVRMLLEKGYSLHIRADNNTKYESEALVSLTDYREVMFSSNILEQLYSDLGPEAIKKIINNYHRDWDPDLKEHVSGYFSDETTAFVLWLIEKRDYELIDLAIEKNMRTSMSPYGKEETLAIEIFNENTDEWKRIKALFTNDISFSRCFSIGNLELLNYLVTCNTVTETTVQKALDGINKVSTEMLRVLMEHLDLSVHDYHGNLPLWWYALRIDDAVAYESIFTKYNEALNDDSERQKIYNDFMWHYHDPDKARILVKCCYFPEVMIKEAELSSRISQPCVLKIVEEEYQKETGLKEKIMPNKVIFSYYDECTWEVKGVPTKSQWDRVKVDDLHYLVSASADGEFSIKKFS